MNDRDARRREVRELVGLLLSETGRATGGIHHTHRAISDRVFRGVGLFTRRSSAPVKVMHDAITDGVYTAVRAGVDSAGVVGRNVADLPLQAPVSRTVAGSAVIAAVNGLIGDELEGRRSPLTEDAVSIRVDGRPVDCTASGVAAAFGDATGALVVFAHGLMETEHAFRYGEGPHYEQVLAERGFTAVHLRYNTGRRVSVNGRDIAAELDALVRNWPVPVERIVLIGHSMGGLVLRSAAHRADLDGRGWVRAVTTTVSLGTPHLGAPLENLAHYASAGLSFFPETSAFGGLLRRRSVGIRDLRGGSLVDEDWVGRDPDALGKAVASEVPLLPQAKHYFVSATVTRSPRNPIGRVIGDGLVLTPSARGAHKARRIGFDPDNGLHLAGANHFTLLGDPAVTERLVEWVG
ncbi:esterase/lipase family protein [Gordonia zhaorongruii]|uniref:esterase/lipase family protein n=1 Tax=Gordonia zhaorongruii TaxID=2597659 RepID=UPI0010468C9D|nr:alpha/beta fold hydrolase [Gordonia zhaorongruii]